MTIMTREKIETFCLILIYIHRLILHIYFTVWSGRPLKGRCKNWPVLVYIGYTRMAGFGRGEIEYMQALCIYNRYIECYSVYTTQYPDSCQPY